MGIIGTVLGVEGEVCQVPREAELTGSTLSGQGKVLSSHTWTLAPVGTGRSPAPTSGSKYKLRGSMGSLLVGYLVLMPKTNFK